MSSQNIALYEAVISNQQLFLRRGNPLCTWWLLFFFFFFKGDLVLRRGGCDETLSARQVQKPSRGGPVVDRRDPPHQPGDQSQLFHARLTLAGGLKVASPSSSPPQANVAPPSNASTLRSIQTEGPGVCRPPGDWDVQAKAIGHQGSTLTDAPSDGWDRPTLVYRLSCPGYFTAGPLPSPEPDSTDELTCNTKGKCQLLV